MLEYGQPMHAFDLSCVKNGHIIVRRAGAGEKTVTLDGKARDLNESMLVIADEDGAVGVAGVMGGENSEITENTKVVLFESALFKASSIRTTSNTLGLASEAATRFKKGLDPVTSLIALERAVSLAVELGAGKAVAGVIDVCSADISPVTITVDAARVNALLGTAVAPQKMLSILENLYMNVKLRHGQLDITLPHFRRDIEGDADIAEEIARVIGYDAIEMTLMRGDLVRGGLSERQRLEDKLKDTLASLGALECLNYSFTGPAMLDKLHIVGAERERAVHLQNPFGEDQSLMRTTLLPGLLQTASLNISRKLAAGRFFEVGNVHFDAPELPEQKLFAGIVVYGKTESFFTLKGMLEALFETFNTPNVEFVPGGGDAFHPTRKAVITINGGEAGWIGQLHPDVGEAADIPANIPVYAAQLDVDALLLNADAPVTITPLPKYPSSARDIAIIVDADALSGDIRKTIAASGGKLLQSAALFDTYVGDKLPEGKKSLAYALEFRSDERTLTDDEVAAAMEKILAALEQKHGAVLRS
jgi:phenylalanyl-tRNA synthetase beta chain